ncbi:MAG: hypothetical protein GY710_01635 [Desulfobacteraceae bacterium]|nr:hypothetical protein [Desulfobacteraceae bacterium]
MMTDSNEEQFIFKLAGKKIPVYRFTVNEKISDKFLINITLASKEIISFDKVGSHSALTILGEDKNRNFHGLVSEISMQDDQSKYKMYNPQTPRLAQKRICQVLKL